METLYNNGNFENAIALGNQILAKNENDTAVLAKIANSYRFLNDTRNAEIWYSKLINTFEDSIDHKYKLFYAQTLNANGKYEEALYWYKKYAQIAPNDRKVQESIKSLENMPTLCRDTTFYIIRPVHINSDNSELCPIYYNNGILFLTDKTSSNGLLEWFYSKIDSTGDLTASARFNKSFKTEFNEGPVTFSNHESKMIFTQNFLKDKKAKKDLDEIPLELFSVNKDSLNQWTNPEKLPFILEEYSYSQPSVTENGKVLYFTSNMPGGFGGYDLYFSVFNGSTWSEPVNLGNNINTPDDELFPYIYKDSILYFSSNGHGGLGSLDIFSVNLNDSSFHIQNLGMPINSSQDDFGIIMDENGQNGYVSSNRRNGRYDDDIYSFKRIKMRKKIKIVDSDTQEPIVNASVYLAGDSSTIWKTEDDGSCTIIIPVNSNAEVEVRKENYEPKPFMIGDLSSASGKSVVIPLQTFGKDEDENIILTAENNIVVSDNKNVVYKVQILASRRPASKKELSKKYRETSKIERTEEDNWYKYTIGKFSSYSAARKCLTASKVADAFVVAYINNKKVHITVAKKETNETSVRSPICRSDLHMVQNL